MLAGSKPSAVASSSRRAVAALGGKFVRSREQPAKAAAKLLSYHASLTHGVWQGCDYERSSPAVACSVRHHTQLTLTLVEAGRIGSCRPRLVPRIQVHRAIGRIFNQIAFVETFKRTCLAPRATKIVGHEHVADALTQKRRCRVVDTMACAAE